MRNTILKTIGIGIIASSVLTGCAVKDIQQEDVKQEKTNSTVEIKQVEEVKTVEIEETKIPKIEGEKAGLKSYEVLKAKKIKDKTKKENEVKQVEEVKIKEIVKVQNREEIISELKKMELEDVKDFKSGKTKQLGYFGKCSIISKPKLPTNFGITAEGITPEGDGYIDLNKKILIEYHVNNNNSVKKVINNKDFNNLKSYISCLNEYSSIISQSLINKELTTNIQDKETLSKNKLVKDILEEKDFDCNFDGASYKYNCSGLKVYLQKNDTELKKGEHKIF